MFTLKCYSHSGIVLYVEAESFHVWNSEKLSKPEESRPVIEIDYLKPGGDGLHNRIQVTRPKSGESSTDEYMEYATVYVENNSGKTIDKFTWS